MLIQADMIKKILNRLNDPKNPSLGPNIIYLKFFGLWFTDRPFEKTVLFYIFYIYGIIYLSSLFFNLVWKREYLIFVTLLHHSALTVGILKMHLFKNQHKKWEYVIKTMAEFEYDITENDETYKQILIKYQRYSRLITYVFLTFGYLCFMIFFVSYWIIDVICYQESRPIIKVFDVYLPFDDTSTFGRYASATFQTIFAVVALVYVIGWDTMVMSSMMFFSGQFKALKVRCAHALDSKNDEVCLWKLYKCHQTYVNLLG